MRCRLSLFFAVLIAPVSAWADAPRVAADIPPVHGLVARVMDGIGTPDMIVPPSASVHSHDLRPSEAAALEAADVVFWVGEGLTPWLARPLAALAGDAETVALLDLEGTELLPFREEHGHDHGHDHAHGGHDDGDAVDPHGWLDPDNAAHWLSAIAETLAARDPANAEAYRANARAGRDEIAAAVAEVELVLAMGLGRYVLFHDSTQYFEARFGLEPVGAVTLGDAAAPGPAHLADLEGALEEAGADCLMVEPGEGGALSERVAESHGLTAVTIDPVGVSLVAGRDLYPALLAGLAASFAACGADG